MTIRLNTALWLAGIAFVLGAAVGHYNGVNEPAPDPLAGREAQECRQLLFAIEPSSWPRYSDESRNRRVAECVLRMKQGRR
jgi:hypothetical protein